MPSIRASTVYSRSIGDFAPGGCVGSSERSMLSAMIASTAAVITATVVVRLLPPPTATTAPGIAAASELMTAASSSAGAHRTVASMVPLSERSGDANVGHDGSAGHETHTFEGSAAEPQHAGPDAGVVVPATDRDEPSERILQRDGDGVGANSARQRHARVQLPAHRWAADGFQSRRELLVAFGRRAAPGGPHDHLTVRPRGLQLAPRRAPTART